MYESLSSSTWVNCWARTVADGHSSVMSTWKTRLTVLFVFECGRKAVAMKSSASGALPPFNVEYCERWKASVVAHGFTPRNSRRQKAETGGSHTHRPPFLSNFPPAAASCSAKFNRVLIFIAVSKWFPADRRRDALSHPRHSIKIRSSWVGRPSFQSVYVNDSKEGETISKAVSMPTERWPSLYRAALLYVDIWRWFMDGVLIWVSW